MIAHLDRVAERAWSFYFEEKVSKALVRSMVYQGFYRGYKDSMNIENKVIKPEDLFPLVGASEMPVCRFNDVYSGHEVLTPLYEFPQVLPQFDEYMKNNGYKATDEYFELLWMPPAGFQCATDDGWKAWLKDNLPNSYNRWKKFFCGIKCHLGFSDVDFYGEITNEVFPLLTEFSYQKDVETGWAIGALQYCNSGHERAVVATLGNEMRIVGAGLYSTRCPGWAQFMMLCRDPNPELDKYSLVMALNLARIRWNCTKSVCFGANRMGTTFNDYKKEIAAVQSMKVFAWKQ